MGIASAQRRSRHGKVAESENEVRDAPRVGQSQHLSRALRYQRHRPEDSALYPLHRAAPRRAAPCRAAPTGFRAQPRRARAVVARIRAGRVPQLSVAHTTLGYGSKLVERDGRIGFIACGARKEKLQVLSKRPTVEVLAKLVSVYGCRRYRRSDNGPEFAAHAVESG